MAALINEIISTILQIAVFTIIPFLFFLFRKNKSERFFRYIGLHSAPQKAVVMALGASTIFLFAGLSLVFVDTGFREIVTSPESVTGRLRAMGLSAQSVMILLLMSVFKTSFSEEIFFRGFIGKRLINALGFNYGNLLQALIFGFVHLALIWKIIGPGLSGLMLIFVFSGFAGWMIGWIKEKHGNGSIVPGWIAHGLGNTVSYIVIAFVI